MKFPIKTITFSGGEKEYSNPILKRFSAAVTCILEVGSEVQLDPEKAEEFEVTVACEEVGLSAKARCVGMLSLFMRTGPSAYGVQLDAEPEQLAIMRQIAAYEADGKSITMDLPLP